jgi:ankyrin repeat protein
MHANVEDRGIKGDCTPLMEAASGGHVDIVRLLIAHGADVNAQSSSGESLFLLLACFHKEKETCLKLGNLKCHGTREGCIVRTFVICTLYMVLGE